MMVKSTSSTWLPSTCWTNVLNSRGSLKIKSKDPFEKPSIVFNYLSTKEDEREWVEAIRVARNILKQKLWTHLMVAKFPGPQVQTDEEIRLGT